MSWYPEIWAAGLVFSLWDQILVFVVYWPGREKSDEILKNFTPFFFLTSLCTWRNLDTESQSQKGWRVSSHVLAEPKSDSSLRDKNTHELPKGKNLWSRCLAEPQARLWNVAVMFWGGWGFHWPVLGVVESVCVCIQLTSLSLLLGVLQHVPVNTILLGSTSIMNLQNPNIKDI